MSTQKDPVTRMVLAAAEAVRKARPPDAEPALTTPVTWPVQCSVGPGLEGAIACESKVGYVNGSKGWLIYRGYDVFELAAYSTFEEVSYLLLHGDLPTPSQLDTFKQALRTHRSVPGTLRRMMGFPVEAMHPMAALRLGVNLMRHEFTSRDQQMEMPAAALLVGTDEDSIAMETPPKGEKHAVYEFGPPRQVPTPVAGQAPPAGFPIRRQTAYRLMATLPTLAAAVARLHQGRLPIEPDPELGHAANFLYMMTGRRPSRLEERVMDVALILHADHGMNASTFAALVVCSTLADMYFAVGAGISALSGPLHGGANEEVIRMLNEIGDAGNVHDWVQAALREKRKIVGFGHRVYKTYDPRAIVLKAIVPHLSRSRVGIRRQYRVAQALEGEVVTALGATKRIFPNVDFYSGCVYSALGIPTEMFTPIFAVSRVAGWTARIVEYLEQNRIFRPRAVYTGSLEKHYTDIQGRQNDADANPSA